MRLNGTSERGFFATPVRSMPKPDGYAPPPGRSPGTHDHRLPATQPARRAAIPLRTDLAGQPAEELALVGEHVGQQVFAHHLAEDAYRACQAVVLRQVGGQQRRDARPGRLHPDRMHALAQHLRHQVGLAEPDRALAGGVDELQGSSPPPPSGWGRPPSAARHRERGHVRESASAWVTLPSRTRAGDQAGEYCSFMHHGSWRKPSSSRIGAGRPRSLPGVPLSCDILRTSCTEGAALHRAGFTS